MNIANSHAGPTVVSSGTLEFADDAVFGSGEVWIGGNLRLLAPWTTSRTIHIPGSGGNPNNVDLRQNVDTNGFDAVWDGSLSGVAALTKSGAGTLAVTRPVPFLGSITVNGGTMVLRGNGAIQSDRVTVASGGVFQLDGTGATGPRVKSSLAATLTGGEIRLVGDATNAVREDLGSLRVVPASLGSNIALVTPGSGSVTLQISTLSRQNAELLVRANSLGGASGTAFQRLRFTTLLGARDGINPGIYTTPGGMGGESLTTDNANSDAAGVIGLQSLAPSYVATTLLQNPATPPTTNALIQPGATTAGSSNTVRSLTFESGGTLSQSASQTLTLSSGQVLVRSGAGPATLSGGTLAFGSQGGTVGLFGDLVLDAAVSGSAGWTKIGPGVLTLGIQPAGAAALTIGSGPVRVSSPTALAHQVVPFGGLRALLDLAGNDTTVGGLSGTGSVNLGGATLTLGSTGAFFQASPTFLGPGQVRIEDGGERIQLRILNVRSAPGGAAVTLASGRFSYHDSNAINPTPLTLAGGVLEIPSGFRVPLILTGAARIGSSGSIAAPATITGPGSLHLEGPDTVTLEVGARHSGETILSGSGSPTLNLTGADGALHTTSAIRLIESGRLVVNYGTSSSERLNDAAPIYLNGGRLIGFAPWNNTAIERIGRLVAGSRGEIELLPNTQFSTTSVLALRPAEIVRENHGTLRIFAHRLASVEMGHHVQIHPAAVPELIGGGAASGPGQSIVPWIVATPNAANATVTFTTHDPIRGLRPLDPSTEFAQGLAGVGAASDNLRLSGTQTLASPLTVNSLLLSEHVSQPALNGPASLAITSGAVLMDASTATIAAPLNFGTQEALFHVHKGYLSVSGQISGAGGLTKSGSQTLALSGDNVLSGAVRLLDGTLAITKPQALGTGGDALHFDGGALHYNGTGPATITRSILLGSDGGRISNGDTAATLTISGSISGSGAINLGGEGAILLTGTSDYTGKTTISTSVKFNSDSALGQSTHLHFDADELEPTFDWVTSRDLHLSGNATISTGTFDVTLNGRLFGEKLTKRGTGTLTLRDADEFSGGISVRQGAVVIEGALAGNPLGESLVFIERGTAVGNGTWERSIHSFGTLSPGPGIGTISARDVTLVSSPDPLENATLALDILSASEFDRLVVRGTFALEGSVELELTLGYNPRDGMDSFLVVDHNGTDPITGASPHLFRFNGNDLDERESFFVNDQQMQLSYFGGDGNDVVLYATPEPTTPAMLIASFALFGCGRRRPASPAR
ncbi:MAG TPA: autotransporter-associated beta strand repeat-containing protein [Glaciihabitans sp.]|nr:autotransporter-associated beta strand repeat-containing protein [Glaciihabitans sp.]